MCLHCESRTLIPSELVSQIPFFTRRPALIIVSLSFFCCSQPHGVYITIGPLRVDIIKAVFVLTNPKTVTPCSWADLFLFTPIPINLFSPDGAGPVVWWSGTLNFVPFFLMPVIFFLFFLSNICCRSQPPPPPPTNGRTAKVILLESQTHNH